MFVENSRFDAICLRRSSTESLAAVLSRAPPIVANVSRLPFTEAAEAAGFRLPAASIRAKYVYLIPINVSKCVVIRSRRCSHSTLAMLTHKSSSLFIRQRTFKSHHGNQPPANQRRAGSAIHEGFVGRVIPRPITTQVWFSSRYTKPRLSLE